VRLQIEEGATDLVVSGDAQALARVLGNLVGNAAKYSPDDTPVDVHVLREVRPFLGDAAIIEIGDRGAGVPAEMREVVFEPFQRLARDESMPGTGLGLAVVRNVVVAHDGRVRILDRDGGGTVVRVELPAEPSKAQ
jgi:signal transduction histidine kinase